MPKKSSGSGASVEGYSFFTFIGHSEDEKSYMHLSTLPENLHIVLIVILCKCCLTVRLRTVNSSYIYIFGLNKKCTVKQIFRYIRVDLSTFSLYVPIKILF